MKQFFITMLSVSLSLWTGSYTANAQVVVEWDKTLGGNYYDHLRTTIPTSDGGYLLTGLSDSDATSDKGESSKDFDYWVVKVDAQRNVQWDKTLGGNGSDWLSTAIASYDGGYLLAGSSNANASGDKSENSNGSSDYWIIKIDPNGNKVWDQTIGGGEDDELRSVILTIDGGYLLAGSSESDASEDKTANSKGSRDYWIVKIDAQGNKQWDKTLGGNSDDWLGSAISTPEGGFLLAGYSTSPASGDKSENSKGGHDYWIVKIDAQGNKLWDKTLGGNDGDMLFSVINTPDDGFLLGGNSTSSAYGDKSENGIGYNDYWIVKIDAQGNKLWDKTFGGSENERLSSMVSIGDGSFLLAGDSFSNASGDKSENNYDLNDYWVVKIDSHGNKQWDKTIGGNYYDELSSIISTNDEGFLLSGSSRSGISGNKSEESKGFADFWIVKLDELATPESSVNNLTLVNAQTNKDIQEIKEDDVINMAALDCSLLSIRANTTPSVVDSVDFKLSGPFAHQYTDHILPYTLFGEHQGDYKGKKWLPGDYTLTVTPYLKGQTGTALSLSFEVKKDVINDHLTIEWDKTLGSPGDNPLTSGISTSDEGYFLGGFSYSDASDDKSEDNKGGCTPDECGPDYWVIKTDARGNKQWDKTLGGSGYDYLYSVISTTDDGYLLGGISLSDASADKSENNKGGTDYWIIKIDEQGNKQWDKTLGGTANDDLHSIIPTSDGGYLLAGFSYSPASGDKSENPKGNTINNDYWIVKIDAIGNKLWDKTIGGNSPDELRKIIPATDGGYILAGYSQSDASGDNSENNKSNFSYMNDYWVVKVDDQGNKQWDKTIGGNGQDELSNVIPSPDGGYLLTGWSTSTASADKSENGKGEWDYWVVKIDSQGNKQWDRTFGGNNKDWLQSATTTSDGGYLLGGFTDSNISGDKSEDSRGGTDYWIIKISAQGNKQWDKTIGGNGYDRIRGIITTQNKGYLLMGSSDSNVSGEKSEKYKGEGGNDYWIVKLKGVDSTAVDAAVASLTLVNAQTDEDIRELQQDDVINLAEVDCSLFSIRANTSPAQVDSVHFSLDGPFSYQRMERKAPYALFSDQQGDYKVKKLKPGEYTITVTPYMKGQTGTALILSFEVTDVFEISRLTLIDATLDKAVCELQEGAVLDLASLQHHLLTVSAETQPQQLDKVVFTLEGPSPHTSTDRQYPYALFSEPTAADGSIDYTGGRWKTGSYTLTATPYLQESAGQSYSISFKVKDSSSPDPGEYSLKVNVYPNPTTGLIHIAHEGNSEQAELRLLDCRGQVLIRKSLSSIFLEQLDLSPYKKGIYYLKVVSPAKVQVIRIVLDY